MQLAPQEKSQAYWKGALKSAVRGIPQGLLLGAAGFAILTAGIFALGAIAPAFTLGTLAGPFGSFLFSQPAIAAMTAGHMPALALASINPLPVVALNTVLTAVGNFITGGAAGVAAYHQQKHNDMYETQIKELEGREQALEQAVKPSLAVQKIIAAGPRTAAGHGAAAEASREVAATAPTLH